MKSALSLALVICLMMSALPVVGAQERTETAMLFAMPDQTIQGPVAKGITAEAIRLAADPLNPAGSTQPPVQVGAEHSAWRDILIGTSIGAGIGMVLGAVVDHTATCVGAMGRSSQGTARVTMR